MRSFRGICYSLAMACMSLAYHVAMPVMRYAEVAISYAKATVRELSCGVEKLKRELVQVFAQDPHHATGIGEGLGREGHGFRQVSAIAIGAEERTALAV